MLALDAHPSVRAAATGLTEVPTRDGLRVVETEAATSTTGRVTTPTDAWTGESSWSGGKYLTLDPGQTASLDLGTDTAPVVLEPVAWQEESGRARTRWTQDGAALGTLRHRVGDQGITAVAGALLPQRLGRTVRPADGPVVVTASTDTVRLDAVLVRPVVSRAVLTGSRTSTLLHSASPSTQRVSVAPVGPSARLRVYDDRGRLRDSRVVRGETTVRLPAYGVAVVTVS